MEIPSANNYSKNRIQYSELPSDTQTFDKKPIRYLVSRYLLSVALVFISFFILAGLNGILLIIPVYFCLGIYMSRTLENVVIWNEHLVSVSDIARFKRWLWVNWFYGIPKIIWDLATSKYL